MKFRTLGSTGMTVSAVGVGTWQFGGEWGDPPAQDTVDGIFDAARERGINLIDTAECYGDHLSEQYIGKAIERDRDQWVLATKFGHKFHGPFDRTEPRKANDVVEQLEASLKSLKTDVIDLWQYHSWGDDEFFDDDVLAAIHKCKDQGKVRHLANSVGFNGNTKQVKASKERGLEAIQIIYNRLNRTPEKEVFDVCREQGLGVLARVPLASGLLSGKYQPGHRFDEKEVRGRRKAEELDADLEKVQQIKRDEVPTNVAMVTWALAWVLQHDAVTCVIPGCKNAEQVHSNADAADLDMVKVDHTQATDAPVNAK